MRLILFFLLFLLLPHVSLHAQSASLTYGQTVTGRITNEAFRVVYTFEGRKGDIVDVLLRRTDGNLDPVLILADDQNNLIARNDDSAASFDAALVSQQLAHDGTYFLIVTRFGQERGMTVGSYSLTLSHVGLTTPSGAVLQYGDSVVGELGGDQFQQIYAFQATRGDIVRAAMQRISGNLDALLILADAQGTVIVLNDEDASSPGSLDATITDLRIKKTGTYLLVATRFGREAGDSHGGYSLTLDRLPPQSLGKVPEKAILLDYGSIATGAIDNDNLMRFYLIDAHKGDVLTISVERTRGNLDPTLTLLAEDLKELAANDSGQRGQNARITTYIVPSDGDYILMVSRFNRDKGITAGSYSLTLLGRIGVTVGPGGTAALPYNSAVNAIINDGNVAQQYTFSATAGDVVTISMATSSGNLACQLVLLDPSRKQIALDDPGTDSARLSKLKLSATGTYTIVASRRGREKGTTQGAYLLTLTRDK